MFQEHAHPSELLVAGGDQLVGRLANQFPELPDEILFQPGGHRVMIAMRPARRLVQDRVDDAQPQQIGGGEPQRLGRLFAIPAALPQDPRATLGADDRIIRVLQHRDPIAHADAQGAARSAFANHHADDRRLQPGHLEHALGDHERLAAFLGADARVGARRIDERDDRQPVFGGHPHLRHRFAVTLGLRTAEIAGRPLLDRSPFLLSDHQYFITVDLRESR